MKTIISIILLIIILVFTTLYATSPKIPDPSQPYSYYDKEQCFMEISRYYQPRLLTYKGHVKKWAASKMDYLNIQMGEELLNYYKDYLSLEKSVNCYILATGDNSLNMGMGPSVFKAVYNSRAKGAYLSIIP